MIGYGGWKEEKNGKNIKWMEFLYSVSSAE